MNIRNYETNGSGYLRAEVIWTADTQAGASDSKTYEIPSSGLAAFGVTQEEYFLRLNIVPDDIPFDDVLQLLIPPGAELPAKYAGCTFPAMHFPLPYVILPLDDTTRGFAIQVGLKA